MSNGQNGLNGQGDGEKRRAMSSPAAWVNRSGAAEPVEERAANLGAVLAAQAHWLTERLLDRHARDFETGGGFSERLYRARTGCPRPAVASVPSVSSARIRKDRRMPPHA